MMVYTEAAHSNLNESTNRHLDCDCNFYLHYIDCGLYFDNQVIESARHFATHTQSLALVPDSSIPAACCSI